MKLKVYLGAFILIFCIILSGCGKSDSTEKKEENKNTQVDVEKVDSFLSRISQSDLRYYNYEDAQDVEGLIHFGIWDNYLANFDVISPDESDYYSVQEEYVVESIKKYFDIDFYKHQHTQAYTYEDGKYIFFGGNVGPTLHVKSDSIEKTGEGTYKVKGTLYNVYNKDQNYGNMGAIIKEHKYKGESTYVLKFYNEERRQ